MERQFTEEIRSLHLGEGATFRGEGILAVTKALVHSGVAYLGGYQGRGAVTWKSIVGTNVAADALSYLSTAGVTGGALIVAGEDYGEGASVALERTHAVALKSSMWLLDPRPNLAKLVRLVGKGC